MNALLLLAAVVLIFTAVCVLRFLDVIRESKAESDAIARWWKDRAEYRATGDSSSLEDDFNSALPDHWQEGRDGVVEFKPRDAA